MKIDRNLIKNLNQKREKLNISKEDFTKLMGRALYYMKHYDEYIYYEEFCDLIDKSLDKLVNNKDIQEALDETLKENGYKPLSFEVIGLKTIK